MTDNLFAGLPSKLSDEQFTELLSRPGVRIARIVSIGQCSPPGFWYDESQSEWVVLLRGAARLQFADEPEPRTLQPGDYVEIAAHRRHRVEWTHPNEPTVWLAVHYGSAEKRGR